MAVNKEAVANPLKSLLNMIFLLLIVNYSCGIISSSALAFPVREPIKVIQALDLRWRDLGVTHGKSQEQRRLVFFMSIATVPKKRSLSLPED
jgi:hypothetical protein